MTAEIPLDEADNILREVLEGSMLRVCFSCYAQAKEHRILKGNVILIVTENAFHVVNKAGKKYQLKRSCPLKRILLLESCVGEDRLLVHILHENTHYFETAAKDKLIKVFCEEYSKRVHDTLHVNKVNGESLRSRLVVTETSRQAHAVPSAPALLLARTCLDNGVSQQKVAALMVPPDHIYRIMITAGPSFREDYSRRFMAHLGAGKSGRVTGPIYFGDQYYYIDAMNGHTIDQSLLDTVEAFMFLFDLHCAESFNELIEIHRQLQDANNTHHLPILLVGVDCSQIATHTQAQPSEASTPSDEAEKTPTTPQRPEAIPYSTIRSAMLQFFCPFVKTTLTLQMAELGKVCSHLNSPSSLGSPGQIHSDSHVVTELSIKDCLCELILVMQQFYLLCLGITHESVVDEVGLVARFEQFRSELTNNSSLPLAIAEITAVTEADEICKALLAVMELNTQGDGHSASTSESPNMKFVKATIEVEGQRIESRGTTFRGNSFASKLIGAYARKVGQGYLRSTLRPMMLQVAAQDLKDTGSNMDDEVLEAVAVTAGQFLAAITDSLPQMPLPMRLIASYMAGAFATRFQDSAAASFEILGGFIFLRFFIPAVLVPESFGVLEKAASQPVKNRLKLVAKLLQKLANGVEFGDNEAHLKNLNEFIRSNLAVVRSFFQQMATVPDDLPLEGQQWLLPALHGSVVVHSLLLLQRHVAVNLDKLAYTNWGVHIRQEFAKALAGIGILPNNMVFKRSLAEQRSYMSELLMASRVLKSINDEMPPSTRPPPEVVTYACRAMDREDKHKARPSMLVVTTHNLYETYGGLGLDVTGPVAALKLFTPKAVCKRRVALDSITAIDTATVGTKFIVHVEDEEDLYFECSQRDDLFASLVDTYRNSFPDKPLFSMSEIADSRSLRNHVSTIHSQTKANSLLHFVHRQSQPMSRASLISDERPGSHHEKDYRVMHTYRLAVLAGSSVADKEIKELVYLLKSADGVHDPESSTSRKFILKDDEIFDISLTINPPSYCYGDCEGFLFLYCNGRKQSVDQLEELRQAVVTELSTDFIPMLVVGFPSGAIAVDDEIIKSLCERFSCPYMTTTLPHASITPEEMHNPVPFSECLSVLVKYVWGCNSEEILMLESMRTDE